MSHRLIGPKLGLNSLFPVFCFVRFSRFRREDRLFRPYVCVGREGGGEQRAFLGSEDSNHAGCRAFAGLRLALAVPRAMMVVAWSSTGRQTEGAGTIREGKGGERAGVRERTLVLSGV